MKTEDVEEINLDEVETYESKGVDLTEFEGKRAKIEKTELVTIPTWYDEAGDELPRDGKPRMTKVLRVTTEKVTEVENDAGEKIAIQASELFNIKYEDGKVSISDSPKAKIQKLLAKLKVKNITEIKGKEVTLRTYDVKGSTFLGFVF